MVKHIVIESYTRSERSLNYDSKKINVFTEDDRLTDAVQELIYEQLGENVEYYGEDSDDQEWVTVETQEILKQG